MTPTPPAAIENRPDAQPSPPHDHFADRLGAAIARVGSPVCVGLDPVYEKLPASLRCGTGGLGGDSAAGVGAIARFCEGVLEAVAPHVPAVKLQSACFERYGGAGVELLRALTTRVRAMGLIAVLDAKRGDIGVSAEHYAAAAFGPDHSRGADALTVNASLGFDTLEPYLRDATRGLFVLVRTSNPGSDAVQSQRLADGRTVAEMMADHLHALDAGPGMLGASGLSRVGAVVGATKPEDAPALRARMPNQVFLVPGYGAQGGTAADVRAMVRAGPGAASGAIRDVSNAGVLVTASRSVIYAGAERDGDWRAGVAGAAKALAAEIRTIVLKKEA